MTMLADTVLAAWICADSISPSCPHLCLVPWHWDTFITHLLACRLVGALLGLWVFSCIVANPTSAKHVLWQSYDDDELRKAKLSSTDSQEVSVKCRDYTPTVLRKAAKSVCRGYITNLTRWLKKLETDRIIMTILISRSNHPPLISSLLNWKDLLYKMSKRTILKTHNEFHHIRWLVQACLSFKVYISTLFWWEPLFWPTHLGWVQVSGTVVTSQGYGYSTLCSVHVSLCAEMLMLSQY